jgi:tetratricopeptide (TPR) repeat protein
MKKLILLLSLISFSLRAQNTVGGTKAIVPEAEVKRQSQFLLAERERLLQHHDAAIEQYKKFLYDNPTESAAWYGLARSHAAKEDLPAAIESIGKAVAQSPDNQWYQVLQAGLFQQAGRLKDAIKTYESLCKRHPSTPEFFEQLAYLSVLAEDPKSGLKALDQLEAITGITEETASKKHLIYLGLGDQKRAAAEIQRLADAHPSKIEHRHRLAQFYESIGDLAAARKTYEDILRRRPFDAAARMALAAKPPQKGNSDAARLATLQPLFSDPKVPIDSKIKELLPFFSKMGANADPTFTQNLLALGTALENAHPDDPKAWSASGDLLYYADRPADALEKYRRCIQLNPAVFSVWDNTLSILAAQKNYPELLRTAEQAMDAFPNQPKAYFFYGAAANLLGRPDDALPTLEQGLLMTANNNPIRPDLLDQVGLALIGKKDYPAAVAHYEKAIAQGHSQHPGLLEHLGDAFALNGQNAQALEQWKKANALRRSPALEQKISAGKL